MTKQGIVEELFKSARKRFPRRKFKVKGLNESWQLDLLDWRKYSQENNGYNYILIVIDVFSKKVWAEPIWRKTMSDVSAAMGRILKRAPSPKIIQLDEGKEFVNHEFGKLMKKYKIHMYSTFSPIKASVAERVIRSFRDLFEKHFQLNDSHKWVDVLQTIMDFYNNRKHRTIKMAPNKVTKQNEKQLLNTVYRSFKLTSRPKFKKSQWVRISKHKKLFEKSSTRRWSYELFKIREVKNSDPPTYLLQDYFGDNILGVFYEQELQLTKYPNEFLYEVVNRRPGEEKRHYLGYDSTHDEWKVA